MSGGRDLHLGDIQKGGQFRKGRAGRLCEKSDICRDGTVVFLWSHNAHPRAGAL